jgi:hypothetical protein
MKRNWGSGWNRKKLRNRCILATSKRKEKSRWNGIEKI